MSAPDRFSSLMAVKQERERLRALRDGHRERLRAHADRIQEPGMQRGMIKTLVRKAARKVFTRENAGAATSEMNLGWLGTLLGTVIGWRAKSGWRRMLAWALPTLLPWLSAKLRDHERTSGIWSELGLSLQRILERWRQRKQQRAEEA